MVTIKKAEPLKIRSNDKSIKWMQKRVIVRGFIRRPRAVALADKISKDLYSKGFRGKIWCSILLERWEASKKGGVLIGQTPHVFSFDEYGEYELVDNDMKIRRIVINYFYKLQKPKTGGSLPDDEKNDCLYFAIKRSLNEKARYHMTRCTPEDLKEQLGLKRHDPIDIKHIPKVEKIFNVRIFVSGDHSYNSKYQQSYNRAYIELKDGHYTFKGYDKALDLRKRRELSVFKVNKPNLYTHFEGEIVTMMTAEDTQPTEIPLKDWREKNDELKKQYNVVNLRRLQGSLDDYIFDFNNAVHIWRKKGYRIDQCHRLVDIIMREVAFTTNFEKSYAEPIEFFEYPYFKAFIGGLMYAKAGEYVGAYQYDVNSQYPSIMASRFFKFPTKQGVFKTEKMKYITSKLQFGLYHVEIQNKTGKPCLFRFNNENLYTHWDIEMAVAQNLTITSTNTEDPEVCNCYCFPASALVCGSQLFGPAIKKFYEFKQEGLPFSKQILSSLWGHLCEKNKRTSYTDSDYNIGSDIVHNIQPTNKDGVLKIQHLSEQKIFKTSYARLGPFLTSFARRQMFNTIKDHWNKGEIVRVHTDGFISTVEVKGLLFDNSLGAWKIEHSGDVIVESVNKYRFN